MMQKLRMSALFICFLVLLMIAPSCHSPAAPTPPSIPMTPYENTEHGFSIEYPEGWTENVLRPGAYFSLEFRNPEGRLSASVSVEYKTEEIILADLVSEAKAYMESMPQYELVSEGDTTIGEGISGYEIVGKGDLGTGKVEKFRFVTLVRGKQCLWVGVSGEPADFDQQGQLINAIVDSFKLLPTYTFVPPTPSPGGTYTSAEHGFSIEYPEGWTENVLRPGAYFSLEFRDPEGRLSASVSVEYKTDRIILADLVSEAKAYLESMPQYELISEGDTTIGEGILGYEIVGKGDLGRGKVEKFRFVTLAREKQGFWVGVSGEPADFDQQGQLINTIVDSFKLLPTYTFIPPTPSPGGTYTSAEHGFSITYPAGWMESPTGRPGEVVSFASAEGLSGVSVSISPVGEGTTLAEFGPQLSQDLGQHWGDYELVSEGEITLDDGTPAYETVFSGTMEGYALKAKYVIVIHQAKAFFVTGFSTPARFEQDEAVLDGVIHSFHLE